MVASCRSDSSEAWHHLSGANSTRCANSAPRQAKSLAGTRTAQVDLRLSDSYARHRRTRWGGTETGKKEKKDERGEGSVVIKTGNQINASFMGTRSRSWLPWKHRNSFRRRRARDARDGTANANDKSIAFVKPELRLDLWYIVTCVKISSTQSVLVGMMRSLGSCHLTTALTATWK